jgi:hypothetical protein
VCVCDYMQVETAGDCYIVCGGLLREDEEGFHALARDSACDAASDTAAARRVLNFAREMMYVAKTVIMPHNGQTVQQRVGIHSGPVAAGLIGSLLPKFALFGDTMVSTDIYTHACHAFLLSSMHKGNNMKSVHHGCFAPQNTASRMESTSLPGMILTSSPACLPARACRPHSSV